MNANYGINQIMPKQNDNYKIIIGRSNLTNQLMYFTFVNNQYDSCRRRMTIEEKDWWGIK